MQFHGGSSPGTQNRMVYFSREICLNSNGRTPDLTSSNGDLNAELGVLNNILGIASTHVVRLKHFMIHSL